MNLISVQSRPAISECDQIGKYFINLPLESIFLHRDEFLLLFPNALKDFPIAYLEQENQLKIFISVQEMNELQSEQELFTWFRSD